MWWAGESRQQRPRLHAPHAAAAGLLRAGTSCTGVCNSLGAKKKKEKKLGVTHSVHLAVSPSQLQTGGWGSNKPVSRPISQKRSACVQPVCTACAASGAPAALVHVAAGATGSYVRQLSSSLQGWQEPSGITPLQERQRRARSGQLVSPNADMGSPKGMLQLACLASCARQAQSVPPTGPSPAHMVSAQRVQVEVGLVAFTLVHSAQLAVLQLTHLPLSE